MAITLKANKAYKTMQGLRVDILKVGLPPKDGFTCVGLIWSVNRQVWTMASYKSNGQYSATMDPHYLDIVEDWVILKVLK